MFIKKNAYQEQQYFAGIKAFQEDVNLQNCFRILAGGSCNHGRNHEHSVSGHLSYRTDIATCNFWLFPTLKKDLRRQKFDGDVHVKNTMQSVLKRIPSEKFKKTMHVKWQERIERCFSSEARYFEKDRVPLEEDGDSE